jgi:hypothetical protein
MRVVVARPRRPLLSSPPKAPSKAMLDYQTLSTEAYFIGKGIILFTMMYCSMNWWHYRSARLRKEKEDKDENKH